MKHAHLKNIKVDIKKSIQKPMHMLFETEYTIVKDVFSRHNIHEKESIS